MPPNTKACYLFTFIVAIIILQSTCELIEVVVQVLTIICNHEFVAVNYLRKRLVRMTEHEHFVLKVWAFVFTLLWIEHNLVLEFTEWVHLLGGAEFQITNIIINGRMLLPNIINLNGLTATPNQINILPIPSNFMRTPLILHINMPQNSGLVKIHFNNPFRFAIISFAPKNKNSLSILIFYDRRTLKTFVQLKW